MTCLPLVYHPDYVPDTTLHFDRLAVVARLAVARGYGELFVPDELELQSLVGLHEDNYLDAYLNGREPLASSSGIKWSETTLRSTLLMLQGQRTAVGLAMERRLAFNLACGFHHAHPGFGGGFCAMNGLAFVAHSFPNLRVAVLDCDEHGADGTEAFCSIFPNLFQVTLFGIRFGVRGGTRSLAVKLPSGASAESEHLYLDVVDDAVRHILDLLPDIVLYQAGMDTHVDDPKSTLRLSTETLAMRDRKVLRTFVKAGVPVVVILAGAYQRHDRIAELYENTFREAQGALSGAHMMSHQRDGTTS